MRTRSSRMAVVSAVATLALVAASCGSDDEPAATTPDEPAATVAEEPADTTADESADDSSGGAIKVALVAPSAVNDLSWTQAMADSFARIGEGREVEFAVTDGTFIVEDAAAAIRGYAEDGFDLVIAHGTQYGGPLQEIADDFPDTSFAIGTSSDFFGKDNIFAYSVDAGQGGYVNGVIAAQLTESNVIGVIGPVPAGDAALYIDGFVAGVAAQNPDVETNVNYIDSFSDVLLASEAAKAHVAAGADVLTGTSQMVVGATGVATEESIPWFAIQSNQTDLGASNVVTSVVYHWEVVFDGVLDEILAGNAGGEAVVISFENGGLEMEYNDGFALDGAVRTSADETVAGLSDGSITVPVAE